MAIVTESNWVRTGAAAKAVGVSSQTLLNWYADGKITAVYKSPGRQLRWDLRKLRAELGIEEPNEDAHH